MQYHDMMTYRKMMGCAIKEHPAGGDESGVLLRAVFGATEQWRTHKQRFYFETCTLMGMLA
ncbi:hypothetical protein BVG97_05355 [Serratia marcescens]|nr:hypothetical protein RN42_19620 [Serratia marcescens]AQT63223.1 hypothetical protein B0W01_03965 [Serratia marcescens]ASL87040.1 hypothetical protein BVG97_05355 [Serratia marcescens]OHT38370.1 hypothetical protein BGV45_01025 [Serratia marcescens]